MTLRPENADGQIAAKAAARRTLERMGYTYNGGELWRPPLGPRPDFNLLDAKNAEIAGLAAVRDRAAELVAALEAEEPNVSQKTWLAFKALREVCRG